MKQFQNVNREDMQRLGSDIKETVNAILTASKEAMTDEEKRQQFDRFSPKLKTKRKTYIKKMMNMTNKKNWNYRRWSRWLNVRATLAKSRFRCPNL